MTLVIASDCETLSPTLIGTAHEDDDEIAPVKFDVQAKQPKNHGKSWCSYSALRMHQNVSKYLLQVVVFNPNLCWVFMIFMATDIFRSFPLPFEWVDEVTQL